MPEGDTIHRAAQVMARALVGRTVLRFESVYPALMIAAATRRVAGRLVRAVEARGKHLLIELSDDLWLRTHMRMHGSWHLYRPGERWRRPRREMRLLLETEAFVAVGFLVPDAEWLTSDALARHQRLSSLGPDLLDPAFDEAAAARRVRQATPAAAIADVLLDQTVLAGIGNVFKSEILFAAGVSPFAPVRDLSDAQIDAVVRHARRQLGANVGDGRALSPSMGRRTTNSLHPGAGLWVYGRAGRPCRRCGRAVQRQAQGDGARLTYWCPQCQRGSG